MKIKTLAIIFTFLIINPISRAQSCNFTPSVSKPDPGCGDGCPAQNQRCVGTVNPYTRAITNGTCTFDPECEENVPSSCNTVGQCGGSETGGQGGYCPPHYRCTSNRTCEYDESCGSCGGINEPCCQPGGYCIGTYREQRSHADLPLKCCSNNICLPICTNQINWDPDDTELKKTLFDFKYDGPIVDFGTMLSGISGLLYPAAVLLGFGFVLVAGYKYMTSEGDPQKIKEAQTALSSAIVGILFVMLSATILKIIIDQIIGGGS